MLRRRLMHPFTVHKGHIAVSREATRIISSLSPVRPGMAARTSSAAQVRPAAVAQVISPEMLTSKKVPVEFEVAEHEKWWNSSTTAVVTGANKGIGKEICRIFSKQGLKTVLAARDEKRGRDAAADIRSSTGNDNVTFAQLDLTDPQSIELFGSWAEEELHNIDILVNNAGLYLGDAWGPWEAQASMQTNFWGTIAVCERLVPLMKSGSRLINVSSLGGRLNQIESPQLVARFQGASCPDDVVTLANEWLAAVEDGSFEEIGWPAKRAYGISKLCLTTWTRVVAKELKSKGISANACNPGWVQSDMTSWKGLKHASEGADTPAWLALLAPPDLVGQYIDDRRIAPV